MNNGIKYAIALSTLLITVGLNCCFGQQSNFHAIYFQNPYAINPAMAGIQKGLNINLGYQQQATSVSGGPKMQNVTADYNSGDNVGLGININSDQTGLINRTRVMGSYAYHLPLSEDDHLSFGLSLGLNDTYIDNSQITGEQGDLSVDRFNNRTLYVDGDFGIAYTDKQLTIQGALPNIKSIFFKESNQDLENDRAVFYTSISYKFSGTDENSIVFEPIAAFRGVKGFANIFDAGVNLDMHEYGFNISGIYHSNQTSTLGFGLNLSSVGVLLAYTSNTGSIKTYANSIFELGLKINFLNK